VQDSHTNFHRLLLHHSNFKIMACAAGSYVCDIAAGTCAGVLICFHVFKPTR
jgi:hypothetical protein